ncbi:MAG: glycoside hydrolase family 5 protein [Sedimentisphaerales bacterium]
MFKVKNVSLYVSVGLLLLIISSCAVTEKVAVEKRLADPFEQNKHLGRGINLGNALDAPREGEWGVTLKEEYFQLIKDAGFDSVRIPCRWSAHALTEKPYTIDPNFFKRVDWAVNCALSRKLPVVLDIHHYAEAYADARGQKAKFLALWEQIASHYKDYPDTLIFELFNEPKRDLTDDIWNTYIKEAIPIVRRTNPNRTIVVGPGDNNIVAHLKNLRIPEDDRNIIVSIHYYFPLEFTHQGADWIKRGDPNSWLGTKWTGSDAEKKAVTDEFDTAAAWAKEHNRPINLGEFGAYEKADMDSRARWTAFVAKSAVERGFSFHYWEFCSSFGAYDPQKNAWREPLLKALIPPKK